MAFWVAACSSSGSGSTSADAGHSDATHASSSSSSTSSSSTSSSSTSSTSTSSTSRSSSTSSASSSSSTSSASSSSSSGAGAPTNHRLTDDACTTPAGPGTCALGSAVHPDAGPDASACASADAGPFSLGNCTQDCQCTKGTGGRCQDESTGAVQCDCEYDSCTDDSACTTGQTCACHGSSYNSGGNTCVPGNCRVDSDCGSGGYCSPSSTTGGCGTAIAGYYCHTSADACVNDADCGGSFQQVCTYSTSAKHWECGMIQACP